jgi:thiamine-phosphate pyrophosphorylase
LLIINDRVDIALAVEADGVHLGQGDMPIAMARRLIGPDRLIGVSSHCLDDLQKAQVAGCDYLGVGPIYTTPTKPGRAAVGFSYLKQAAANAQVPFFAIGGLEAANLEPVLAEAGPNAAVAVVRAVMEAADPGAATKELLKLLNKSY